MSVVPVKGVNFYGPKSEFIVSGSDCGNVLLWEKQSEKVVQYFSGDEGGVVSHTRGGLIKKFQTL